MNRSILILLFVLLPGAALAETPTPDQPHWSLEVKGGTFIPVLKDWAYYYGKRDMPEFGLALACQISRFAEIGAAATWSRAEGQAQQIYHGTPSGKVTYDLVPVDLFVVLHGVLSEDQMLVPYAGGGWTRMYYHQAVAGQEAARGSVDGYHFRLGLELSLDSLDEDASRRMYVDYSVYHTYLFLETQYTHAVVGSIDTDLGGTSYRGGLRFEF